MTDRRVRTGLAALVCALAAACGSVSPGPTVSPAPLLTAGPTQPNEPAMTVMPTSIDEPAPTATDNGVAGTPPCEVFDLKASHGLVEATGDSRSTEVVLVAGLTCSVDAFPTFSLRDADGETVTGGPAGSGALDLVPGVAYTSVVRLSSWCVPDPLPPVALILTVTGGEIQVTGTGILDEGDVPACVGGVGPTLEAGAWEPSA